MRFNLYHACAMAAVLAFSTTNAIALHQNEEAELAECFDADYDFAEIEAEVDADLEHCPKPSACPCGAGACPNKSPCSEYEDGVRSKVQGALWAAHADNKLRGQSVCSQLKTFDRPSPAGGCGGAAKPAAPAAGGCSCGCGAGAAKPPAAEGATPAPAAAGATPTLKPAGDKPTDNAQTAGDKKKPHMCDKARKIIAAAKKKTVKSSGDSCGPQKMIEDLRRKVDEKNKDVTKVREDSAAFVEDMRKDCNKRFETSEIQTLAKDFGDLQGQMQNLVKSAGDKKAVEKLRKEVSSAHGEVSKLEKDLQKTKDKCECCRPTDEDDKKAKKSTKKSTKDDSASDSDSEAEDTPTCDSSKLRMNARNALAKLHAHEQEVCAACKARLTCCGGPGPACGCGATSPCGGNKLCAQPECNTCAKPACGSTCGNTCGSTCGNTCGKPACGSCAHHTKTVNLKLSGGQAPVEKHIINLATGEVEKKEESKKEESKKEESKKEESK